MTPSPPTAVPRHPETTLLRVFSRNGLTMTCDVSVNGAHGYSVTVLSLWNGEVLSVENYTRPLDALCRQAAIGRCLREAGWLVTEHAAMRIAA